MARSPEATIYKEGTLIFNFFKKSSLLLYRSISDITVIDTLELSSCAAALERYLVVYILLSTTYNKRMAVYLPQTVHNTATSISHIYNSAN
jgi:NADH:ubiquinone oxidoreductase subunit C